MTSPTFIVYCITWLIDDARLLREHNINIRICGVANDDIACEWCIYSYANTTNRRMRLRSVLNSAYMSQHNGCIRYCIVSSRILSAHECIYESYTHPHTGGYSTTMSGFTAECLHDQLLSCELAHLVCRWYGAAYSPRMRPHSNYIYTTTACIAQVNTTISLLRNSA